MVQSRCGRTALVLSDYGELKARQGLKGSQRTCIVRITVALHITRQHGIVKLYEMGKVEHTTSGGVIDSGREEIPTGRLDPAVVVQR
jgi:hypothetical protein